MSDELKPQEGIGKDGRFLSLLERWHTEVRIGDRVSQSEAWGALIAHINAWGARLAGDAFEQAAQICEQRGMYWQQEEGSYAAGKKAGAFDAADNIRQLAASPTPDKEPPCGS